METIAQNYHVNNILLFKKQTEGQAPVGHLATWETEIRRIIV
jgi:hypothetical protein